MLGTKGLCFKADNSMENSKVFSGGGLKQCWYSVSWKSKQHFLHSSRDYSLIWWEGGWFEVDSPVLSVYIAGWYFVSVYQRTIHRRMRGDNMSSASLSDLLEGMTLSGTLHVLCRIQWQYDKERQKIQICILAQVYVHRPQAPSCLSCAECQMSTRTYNWLGEN